MLYHIFGTKPIAYYRSLFRFLQNLHYSSQHKARMCFSDIRKREEADSLGYGFGGLAGVVRIRA